MATKETGRKQNQEAAAREHYERAEQALMAARKLPMRDRTPKLKEADRAWKTGTDAVPRDSDLGKKFSQQRIEIAREARLAKGITALEEGGSIGDQCPASEDGLEEAICERELGEGLLEYGRQQANDDDAKRLLEWAGLAIALGARHASRNTTDLSRAGTERQRAETLLAAVHEEATRREAAFYTRSSSAVALIEVAGPRSLVRVDLGNGATNVWCAAEKIRETLIAAGVDPARVLVSSEPPKKSSPSAAGAVIINVRAADRQEKVIDAAAACRNSRDREPRVWVNPFVLRREHDELLSSSASRIAELEAALAKGDLASVQRGIDELKPVRSELPDVSRLAGKLTLACETEVKRAVRGELRGEDARVARLTVCALPFQHVAKMMERAGQSCLCGDEFERRDCLAERETALTVLRSPLLMLYSLDTRNVEIGEYDFKTKVFSASLAQTLVQRSFATRCAPKVSASCAHFDFPGMVRQDDNQLKLVSTGNWRGSIRIDDVEAARAFKAAVTDLGGAAIFAIQALNVQAVVKPDAELGRRVALERLGKQRASRRMMPEADQQELKEAEQCLRDEPITFQEITARATVVGIDLDGVEASQLTSPQ